MDVSLRRVYDCHPDAIMTRTDGEQLAVVGREWPEERRAYLGRHSRATAEAVGGCRVCRDGALASPRRATRPEGSSTARSRMNSVSGVSNRTRFGRTPACSTSSTYAAARGGTPGMGGPGCLPRARSWLGERAMCGLSHAHRYARTLARAWLMDKLECRRRPSRCGQFVEGFTSERRTTGCVCPYIHDAVPRMIEVLCAVEDSQDGVVMGFREAMCSSRNGAVGCLKRAWTCNSSLG